MSRLLCTSPLVCLLALSACVESPSGDTDDIDDTTTADTSSSGAPDSTGQVGPTTGEPATTADPDTTTPGPTTEVPGTTTDEPDPTTGEPDPSTTTTTADTTTTTTTDDTTTTGDDTTTGGLAEGGEIPPATAECPEIVDGVVDFEPDGVGSRAVRIWVDPDVAAEKDGPLVFFWYGTGGEPDQALSGLGDLGIQEILDMGGIVAAPTHDPGAGVFPWFLVLGQQQDDLLVADEILACADQQFGVDAARIHSLGFSAGALHTAQMSARRSSYLASVTLYSGGLIFGSMPMFDNPDNDFPAMIFHGGDSDVVVVGFKQASADYAAYLGMNDNFSFTCDHGMGHTIPPEQDSVMQFFADHPWGTAPEPYQDALPGGFPDYCILP
jgi:predicted esterase